MYQAVSKHDLQQLGFDLLRSTDTKNSTKLLAQDYAHKPVYNA